MTQQAVPSLFWLKIIFTVCTVCHSLQARKAIIYIFNQPLLSPPPPSGALTMELSQRYPGRYISNESGIPLIIKL